MAINASGDVPELIASGDKIEGKIIVDEELWQKINSTTNR